MSARLATASDSQFHSGWASAPGVEVMFAPKWSVKAEYLYRSFEATRPTSLAFPGGLAVGTLN
jgi:outer membrane immunogenic protein